MSTKSPRTFAREFKLDLCRQIRCHCSTLYEKGTFLMVQKESNKKSGVSGRQKRRGSEAGRIKKSRSGFVEGDTLSLDDRNRRG